MTQPFRIQGAVVPGMLVMAWCLNWGCRPPPAPPPPRPPWALDQEDGTASNREIPDDPTAIAPPVVVHVPEDDPEQWLFVRKAREGSNGAWATGTFDLERNKIHVRTHDVDEFVIDTSRIPINWERLVIIGIDGHNSELRKREDPVLPFVRDRSGLWAVAEP